MKENLKINMKVVPVLDPQTLAATAATTGVNNADCEGLSFAVQVGAFSFSGSNKLDLIMQHSDDGTTYANCAALDIFDPENGASAIAKSLDGTEDQSMVHIVSYRGVKPYARLNIVETGTVSVACAVTAIKGALKERGTI